MILFFCSHFFVEDMKWREIIVYWNKKLLFRFIEKKFLLILKDNVRLYEQTLISLWYDAKQLKDEKMFLVDALIPSIFHVGAAQNIKMYMKTKKKSFHSHKFLLSRWDRTSIEDEGKKVERKKWMREKALWHHYMGVNTEHLPTISFHNFFSRVEDEYGKLVVYFVVPHRQCEIVGTWDSHTKIIYIWWNGNANRQAEREKENVNNAD